MSSHTGSSSMVRHLDEQHEYFFREGCYILELLNDQQDESCSIARARVLPGKETRQHKLIATAERYVILQGEGTVTIEKRSSQVQEGSVVFIPEAHVQNIRNTGTVDLVFLAICTPRFKSECYVDVERL